MGERVEPYKGGSVSARMKKRNPTIRFSSSHIKRMMQVDEDIGKMAHAVPAMVGRATELFSTILVKKAGRFTQQKGAKTMTLEHIANVIKKDPMFDFLVHLVEGVGHDTSVKETSDIAKSVKVNKESVDLKARDKNTQVTKLKSQKEYKTSTTQCKNSKPTRNLGLSGPSRSNNGNGIQMTLQIMPVVPEANQIAVPGVSQFRSDAQLVQMDEDYDS